MSTEQAKELVVYFLTGAGTVTIFGALSVIVGDMLGISEKKALVYIVVFCILSAVVGLGFKTYIPL